MISVEEALKSVEAHSLMFPSENTHYNKAVGRFLSQDVFMDRDAPPYNRVMMDGIAVQAGEEQKPILRPFYKVQAIQPAGAPAMTLQNPENCIEVMTGSILPKGTDTVIAYENIDIKDQIATIKDRSATTRYIHYQGSDHVKGSLALQKGRHITAADISILTSVGLEYVPVFQWPRVALVSTGNELVEVYQTPEAHQIRSSNIPFMQSALYKETIEAKAYHLLDEYDSLQNTLKNLVNEYEVIILTGGVSKGKFDLLPEVLEKIGVRKIFHRVAQRPGRPFFFGQFNNRTIVFAFPGNPVSAYVCFQFYFKAWLYKSCNNQRVLPVYHSQYALPFSKELTLFQGVNINRQNGFMELVSHNGSGDLISLSRMEGFAITPPQSSDILRYLFLPLE